MDNLLTRDEHNEFVRRMEDEHRRLRDRLEGVEDDVEKLKDISINVSKLADNMKRMLDEQTAQGKRLETLEGRDGELWRKATGYVVTTIISIIVGFVFAKLGIV